MVKEILFAVIGAKARDPTLWCKVVYSTRFFILLSNCDILLKKQYFFTAYRFC